jgi:hypothetical protein
MILKEARYEREHSMSLWHMDWKQLLDGRWWIAAMDDASRLIVSYGVFQKATAYGNRLTRPSESKALTLMARQGNPWPVYGVSRPNTVDRIAILEGTAYSYILK